MALEMGHYFEEWYSELSPESLNLKNTGPRDKELNRRSLSRITQAAKASFLLSMNIPYHGRPSFSF